MVPECFCVVLYDINPPPLLSPVLQHLLLSLEWEISQWILQKKARRVVVIMI